MAEPTGHARAIEIALSFKLIRNEDLAKAREACGPGSGSEDHLTWLLDEGTIPENAAEFLSKFMAALRAKAPTPPQDLLEAATALMIDKDRLELVWGAQSARPATQRIPVVTEAEKQEMPAPAMKPPATTSPPLPAVVLPRSKAPIVLVGLMIVVAGGGWYGWKVWQDRRWAEAAEKEREARIRDAEAQVAPVRKLLDAGERPSASDAKDAEIRLNEALRKVPNHLPFLMLQGRLAELLGDDAGALKAFDAACRANPSEPAAFAARGLWKWRKVQRERSLPWRRLDLRGMRARQEVGEARQLAKEAIEDCTRGGSDPLAAAVVAVSKGQPPQLAGIQHRDAALLRGISLLREERPDSAARELAEVAETDAAAIAIRAAAMLMGGRLDEAVAEATRAIDADAKAWTAYEVRALARWAKAEAWHWSPDCDKAVWQEKAEPLYVAARADWKRMPLDAEEKTPAICAARCAISQATGAMARGVDPKELAQEAVLELGAFPKTDAEAQALLAQAHLAIVERLKADGQDSRTEREKVAAALANAERADPKHPEVLIARGLWEAALGRAGDAKKAWEEAKKANPEDPRPDAYMLGRR